MKKIFAIALAVVMVLSMASAFALSVCATWGTDWSCTTDADLCGKAKIEIVPYVKVNTSCGWEYQVSDCASAIRTENVYFAIKVTVDANPDPDWFEVATIELEDVGLSLAWNDGIEIAMPAAVPADGDTSVQHVYYLTGAGALLDEEADDFELARVVYPAVVENANVCTNEGYSVCATLKSEYDGWSVDKYNNAGDYHYAFNQVGNTDRFNAKGEFTGVFGITDGEESAGFTVTNGVIGADTRTDNDFYLEVLNAFGLANCGTAACITEDNIKANFGWDDEQTDCFDWSEKGASVVDTDCVVAIPKTGDASVLAWLF